MQIRITVAVETPTHGEGFHLSDFFHRPRVAMAFNTSHSGTQMCGMIEIGVIWQLVDTHPVDWLTCVPALAHQRQLRAVGCNLAVTIHARCCWRDIGMARFFYLTVTIAAVYSHIARMKLVAERNRLGGTVADLEIFGRTKIPEEKDRKDNSQQGKDSKCREQVVHLLWEDLGQGCSMSYGYTVQVWI